MWVSQLLTGNGFRYQMEISHIPYLRCALWFVIGVLWLSVTFGKSQSQSF